MYTYLINPGRVLQYRREHTEADSDRDSDESGLKNKTMTEFKQSCCAERAVDLKDQSSSSGRERRHSIISE